MSTSLSDPRGLDPERLIPDLLREFPATRAVLDQHGLRGCGGPDGPYETLRYFARAHGVDEARLMDELRRAVASPETVGEAAPPSVADTIYRRFFLAGITVVLTAGATWGAWLLWSIGLSGTFRAVTVHAVNAHGEAQIFGWVGLFIMGFAYQAFPRIWQSSLAAPRLAVGVFVLMMAGLVVRTVGITAADSWELARYVALAGGLLQLAAVVVFAGQVLVTFRRSGMKVEAYVGFVLAALGWFVLSTAFSVWHIWNTMTAADLDRLVWAIATYQAPLRDLQIHGLALFMILGVSMRMLPGLYGLPRVPERRAWWALAVLTASLVGEVGVFVAYRWTGIHAIAAVLLLAWAGLLVGSAMVALPWRLWRPLPEYDRSAKFVRAAYAWLPVSLVMLLLMPAYQAPSGEPFSHAYFGATRHAITVGFISLMIMGIASKVVATLNGVDPKTLTRLWGPFLLVNTGCLLRVTTQILTDWTGAAYPVIGLSGTLEVIGLAWWGAGLVAVIQRGRALERAASSAAGPAPARIEPEHRVADVLDWFPGAEPVFLRHGFHALNNAALRRTLARRVTLAQAAAMRGVDLSALLRDLNETARVRTASLSLVTIEAGHGAGHAHDHAHDHAHEHGAH